jgi:hypothetical protein
LARAIESIETRLFAREERGARARFGSLSRRACVRFVRVALVSHGAKTLSRGGDDARFQHSHAVEPSARVGFVMRLERGHSDKGVLDGARERLGVRDAL